MEVTKEIIVAGLKGLGIRPGDVLMVHSSMKSLGRVAGGPDTVVDALLEAVGEEGLVIVPTLTGCLVDPETGRAPCAYDRATTPSRVGLITNTLRMRPEAHRSGHPTHSIAAIGRRAAELTADGLEPYRTFDRTGPFGRYVRWGARILFIGCGLHANTTFHAIEDWLELPYIARLQRKGLVRRPDGTNEVVHVTMCPGGHRDFYVKAHPSKIERVLEECGLLTRGKVGEADCILLDARDCLNVTARRMEADPAILLCDDPACGFCSQGRRGCLEDLEAIRARARRLREEGYLSR